MSLEESSIPIVHLAWARLLGCGDEEFAASRSRLTVVDDDAPTVTFVQLFGRSLLKGPGWVVQEAEGLSDRDLVQHSTLLRLTRNHGGRGLGASALYVADDLPLLQPEKEVLVSMDAADAVDLEALCPPDDVHEVELSSMDRQFVLMEDEKPVAGAGYRERAGLLAQLGALVVPQLRRRGRGTLIAAIAGHEALAAGLIPQWRAEVNNAASRATALKLGFVEAGSQTSVLLG